MQRLWLMVFALALALQGFAACSPAGDGDGDGDADADQGVDAGDCAADEWRCSGIAYQTCDDGEWVNAECEGVCVDELGCVACTPGERYCEGETVMECNDDGSGGELVIECDVANGYQCTGGACANACSEAVANRSNVGCEYWAVDLDNAENSLRMPGFPDLGDDAAGEQFAVVVANTDLALTARVTVEINTAPQGDELELETVAAEDVGPGQLKVLELPRRDADGEEVTRFVDDGPQSWLSSRAFRITSTAPVVAYQFNPINQKFSNDASLLLPTSGLDTHHIVLGYPPGTPLSVAGTPKNRAYVAIVATAPDTHVKVTPSSTIAASVEGALDLESGMGQAVPEIAAGDTYEVDMGPFDLLNLETPLYTLSELMSPGFVYPELTGTIVESNHPVAVYFGVDLTSVAPDVDTDPDNDDCCAEHLEAAILPTSTMGKRFIATRSPPRGSAYPEVDVYRVMAVRDGTTITTSLLPGQEFPLDAGRYIEFDSAEPFILEATEPVHLAQFMVSQSYTEDYTGDPSMLMYPAFEQWRGAYLFTTGRGFDEDYAVIAMPEDAEVTLDDGSVMSGICDDPIPIGDMDDVSYVEVICPIEDGAHTIDSGEAYIGVSAYGYYGAGSYAYSAGSELHQIFLY